MKDTLFAERLLAWYDREKRQLPWRKNKDPYRIWVSEIMLQQTRVETVIPYFERFMARFPTLESLAAAPEEEVLTYWQGLGYYSRARNLQRGVREVVATYNGKVPTESPEIKGLSGIGDYTAGAILSMAYGQASPAIDGNVLRIFSRLYCLDGDIGSTKTKREVASLVSELISKERPGDFNQALMDLGAGVCVPQKPRCTNCPVTRDCLAWQRNETERFPIKRPKKQPRPVEVAVAVIKDNDRFLLEKRPDKGLLAGMWQFPAVEQQTDQPLPAALAEKLAAAGVIVQIGAVLSGLTHTFSHIRWMMTVYSCQLLTESSEEEEPLKWVAASEMSQITWAGPHAKIAKLLMKD